MTSTPPIKKIKLDSQLSNTTSISCVISKQSQQLNGNTKQHNDSNGVTMELNGDSTPSVEIDDALYSRQLYVLGHEAMRSMAMSDILICGLRGLGVEVAKNVILGGVKSVTLHDDCPATIEDLSGQFYIHENQDLGKPRAEACRARLAELNNYVTVNLHIGDITDDIIRKHQVVVLSESTLEEQLRINEVCHENNIKFISASTAGLFGSIFCDFGKEFIIRDKNGEPPMQVMIDWIESSNDGIVTCTQDSRHDFEDGDYVTFTGIKGMVELNNCKPLKVKVIGPTKFGIGNTSNFSTYESGGIAKEVKMPQSAEFLSLKDALKTPEFVMTDFAKFDRPLQIHVLFQALSKFRSTKNRFPNSWDEADAKEFSNIAETIAGENSVTLCSDLSSKFSYVSSGQVAPIHAVIGGSASQEVMKACSGRFNPIKQFLYFDALECLTDNASDSLLGNVKTNSLSDDMKRYSAQIAVFGQDFQEKLLACKLFLVGAGALGCELLKNFALMGVGCSKNGSVIVTDMDTIEKSNLNRQFLFRPGDIQQFKSRVAARAVKEINPSFTVVAQENRVGQETEDVYDDKFFESLTGVVNALDNVEARMYMDRRCVYYRKPLLESGTTGTKGNTQVVLPMLTESYSSSQDPPEKTTPICTLKNFPYQIEHTIQWARDFFEGAFSQPSQSLSSYLDDQKFVERTAAQSGPQAFEVLEQVKSNLTSTRPTSFEDCISWARLQFEEMFVNQIKQLLFNFPADQLTSSGAPFWSGTKKCPHPLKFDSSNPEHVNFVLSAANLRAFIYGIPSVTDRVTVARMAEAVPVKEFVPKAGVRIATTDAEMQAQSRESGADLPIDKVVQDLEAFRVSKEYSKMKVCLVEFEKDDDTNFHMDFVTACSNLRANNYEIEPADKHKTKLIAGKIIPAIATTTSVVVGLVCLELYKIIQGHSNLERFKNGFLNLAHPFFAFSEPLPPMKQKYYDNEFTMWDRFEIDGELTLKQLIDHFEKEYNLEVSMVTQGVCVLYSFFMGADKKKDRLNTTISNVVREVTKKEIPPHVNSLVIEVSCNDTTGEDVEVPYIKYNLPKK